MNPYAWAEKLANEELIGELSTKDLNPTIESIIEEGLDLFLKELYQEFNHLIQIFNSKNSNHPIKIYKIAQTDSDFVMIRKSLKLVFSSKNFGILDIYFTNYLDQYLLKNEQSYKLHLKAKMGPFNEILWEYENEKVSKTALIQYLFTAFIKQTA